MELGLVVALSEHEEVTLRRVAYGIAKANALPAGDIKRLQLLKLVEMDGERAVLTALGQRRVARLVRGVASGAVSATDHVTALMKILDQKAP